MTTQMIDTPARGPASHSKMTVDFAASLGRILSVTDLYGIQHQMAITAVEAGYALLVGIFETDERLSFSLVENQLLANRIPVDAKNALVTRLVERLQALDVAGFALTCGMSEDEFARLIILLTSNDLTPGTDGFVRALEEGGVTHVSATRGILREIQDDEEVLRKGETGAGAEGDAVLDDQATQQIIAFLKGDVTLPPSALDDAAAVASQADKLAELMMSAASVRRRDADHAGGETVGDLLVGCLQRTFKGLMAGKASRTQAGRKRIATSMLMLEEEVLARLHNLIGEDAGAIEETLAETVRGMRDEIKVAGLISDYGKRERAATAARSALGDLVQTRGDAWAEAAGVNDRLREAGLGDEGWRQLVVDPAATAVPARPGGAEGAGGNTSMMLARVLDDLSRLMQGAETCTDCEETTTSMSQALEQVRREVVDVVSQTEAKIDALARHVSEPADGHEGAPGSDGARRTPWDMVPEIVQELCQPLTVLNCTIEMLQDERFGVVNVAARQALELASDCTRRMKDLADRLVLVCGVPGSLEPDKGCLG